jgi:hypothetical protein
MTLQLMRSLALCASFVVAALGCRTMQSELRDDSGSSPVPAFLRSLADMGAFSSLARTSFGQSFVKYAIVPDEGARGIFFQNTRTFDFHLEFLARTFARYTGLDPERYEHLIFAGPEKEVSAGALYAQGGQANAFGFTLYAKPAYDAKEILEVFSSLTSAAPLVAGKLTFIAELPLDEDQLAQLASANLPITSPEAFFGVSVTTYHPATSYGFLKSISKQQFEEGDYTSKDILVFEDVPLDVGPLAGIVALKPEVPHSHVVLRSINQNIPNIFIPGALDDEGFRSRLGQLVELTTFPSNEFTVRGGADFPPGELEAKAEAYFKGRVPQLPPLEADLQTSRLLQWRGRSPGPTDGRARSYGAKAANFELLDVALNASGVDRSLYKGGFMVPFRFYDQHMRNALTTALCQTAAKSCRDDFADSCTAFETRCGELVGEGRKTLRDFFAWLSGPENGSRMIAEGKHRRAGLKFGRKLISSAPLNAAFLRQVRSRISGAYAANVRIRFRSSTNAEDLPGLNGAGLYESESGCAADEGRDVDGSACQTATERQRIGALVAELTRLDPVANKALIKSLQKKLKKHDLIADAVRDVYASTFSEPAYLFRDYYRLPHERVFMGLLVHPSFVDESGNGVLIVRPGQEGGIGVDYVAQVDDISITNPELPNAVAERVSYRRAADGTIAAKQVRQTSNLAPEGRGVLSDAQVKSLGDQVATTHAALAKRLAGIGPDQAFDLEFMLDRDGRVVIKQGRPLPEPEKAKPPVAIGPVPPCSSGDDPISQTLVLDTLSLQSFFCRAFGTSGTKQYEVVRVIVTDSAAPGANAGKPFVIDAPDTLRQDAFADKSAAGTLPASFYAYRINHHNSCDSVVIKLPHATYGIIKGLGVENLTTCTGDFVLPGAPTREDSENTIKVRVQYGDEPPVAFERQGSCILVGGGGCA